MMGAPRRKPLVRSRKRVEEEGEEEEGGPAPALEEDSMSDASVMSDADDDADGEGSDDSEPDPPKQEEAMSNGHRAKPSVTGKRSSAAEPESTLTPATGDTEAMLNGLNISDAADVEELHFDEMAEQPEANAPIRPAPAQSQDDFSDKRRKEHEEYRRKRDNDPAFVPNRGGFFMHDHRSSAPSQHGSRPFARGGIRGRGGVRGGATGPGSMQSSGPADAPWAHDLHDTVADADVKPTPPYPQQAPRFSQQQQQQQQQRPPLVASTQPPNRSFSKSTRLGDMQVRIFLQGMSEPKVFSGVARNSHTRLPHHRPPLRRDKPVRISIPDMPIRHIFPSTDRSFIFIPRALRPNQQGFGRIRGRGSLGAGFGSFGPMSSRRTSVYAGSAYSPSVALSRRSSLAREVSTASLASPTQAMMPQQPAITMEAGKPVVRLPPSTEQNQPKVTIAGMIPAGPPSMTYPLPQKPAFHENRPEDLPMHHPKPERSLQVADIESPAAMQFNPSAAQQQPFHQQVPMQVAPPPYPQGQLAYPHSRHPSHPSQASGGTPLPQIPEAAIHAQPFQPYPYPPPQGFYPQQYPLPTYYYPAPEQAGGPPATASSFIPGQPYFYPLPMGQDPPTLPPPPPPQAENNPHSGTVAHEAGGMVYYYNSSELTSNSESAAAYTSTYATAPPTSMEGMALPLYYQPPVYYPAQP